MPRRALAPHLLLCATCAHLQGSFATLGAAKAPRVEYFGEHCILRSRDRPLPLGPHELWQAKGVAVTLSPPEGRGHEPAAI